MIPIMGSRFCSRPPIKPATLVLLGQTVCQIPEDFKAWSQNLGHDKVLTTFPSYGQIESPRQGEIILGTPQVGGRRMWASWRGRWCVRYGEGVGNTS